METQLSAKKDITVLLFGILCLLVTCWGCSTKPPRVYRVAYSYSNPASQPSTKNSLAGPYNSSNTVFAAPGQAMPLAPQTPCLQAPRRIPAQMTGPHNVAAADQYHIGPGDILEVRVSQLLDLDREALLYLEVDRQGQIYMPLLNHVPVAGMTCAQTRHELMARLGREFIRDPKVGVTVKNYRSKEIVVMGTVGRPGLQALQSDSATLLDVISRAGGIRPHAAPDIEILRGGYNSMWGEYVGGPDFSSWAARQIAPGAKREIVPVSRLFAGPGKQLNPNIYPGDVVNVLSGREGFIYVSGEVEQPGAKNFHRPLSLLQALTCAGGTTNIAKEKECKIIRRHSDGSEEVMIVDLKKVRQGKEKNIILAQNDTIIVPVHGVKKFFDELDQLIKRGVNTGVDVTYDAGARMGLPGAAAP